MMANMTLTEQALVEALNQWTTKQGVVLTQVNPFFFMQVLRDQGLEIVKSEELTKIRYEHKFLRELITTIFRTANSAKVKIQQLDENKELLIDRYKAEAEAKALNSKPLPKAPRHKV